MLLDKRNIKEHHKNGALWINQDIGIIEPLFYNLYPNRLTNDLGECYIKLKYEKFFDNGQFAWSLIWDENGKLINKKDNQFRKDGTIIIY